LFTFPSLLWIGLPLVALPILIHLINMLRHRRVKWAAMDFLLQSQQRQKKWIVFKQLLLLLLRMSAIAAVALMVAQPVLRNRLGELLGAAKTHHVVLIDDSYSMSDRWGNTSAFDQAKQVVQRLADRVAQESALHKFSLMRFSEAQGGPKAAQPAVYHQIVDPGFAVVIEKVLGPMEPSESAAGPVAALESVVRDTSAAKDETRIIYLISDFRAPQWSEATEPRKLLEKLNQMGVEVQLIQCVDAMRDNVAVTGLAPQSGVRAAGVETFAEVTLHNFGRSTARHVTVALEEDNVARPGIVVDSIAPGETVVRRFRVNFANAGYHSLTARLSGDSLSVDDSRYYTVDVPGELPVLIVDGSSHARDAFFLATALAPGGKTSTGWRPQIENARFLEDPERIEPFAAIFLLNVERLSQPAIDSLESYVKNGGGVAFFLGEKSRADYYNEQLYRDGEGLFPLPLNRPTELLVDRVDESPDLTVSDHPVFAVLAGKRNSFLQLVRVERYFAAAEDWKPESDPNVEVLATLRNGAPFVATKRLGEGRVFAQLSKISPEMTRLGRWNNWAVGNPTFPVVMNELAGFLSATRRSANQRFVGDRLALQLNPQDYHPQIRFQLPGEKGGTVDVAATATVDGLQAELDDTSHSGLYEAQLLTTAGRQERRVFGYNVDTAESDLSTFDGPQLAARLPGVDYSFHRAADLDFQKTDLAGFNLSDSLLYLLLGILIIEQLLAYSASYHPPRSEARRR